VCSRRPPPATRVHVASPPAARWPAAGGGDETRSHRPTSSEPHRHSTSSILLHKPCSRFQIHERALHGYEYTTTQVRAGASANTNAAEYGEARGCKCALRTNFQSGDGWSGRPDGTTRPRRPEQELKRHVTTHARPWHRASLPEPGRCCGCCSSPWLAFATLPPVQSRPIPRQRVADEAVPSRLLPPPWQTGVRHLPRALLQAAQSARAFHMVEATGGGMGRRTHAMRSRG
jgi:hypothetical protein